MPTRWSVKTHALLHDPPHKPIALGRGHERQGRSIAEALVGAPAADDVWKAIKTADALASGADRESWLRELKVDPRTELALIHPLDARPVMVPDTETGRALQLVFSPELIDRAEEVVGNLVEAFSGIDDERLRYLLLWRFAADILREIEQHAEQHERRFRLGVLWELFPADTRIPDHSLVFHDSLVAALAPIVYEGQNAALLRFAVGPVQSFIQSARKLRDLWAASSILADSTWHAMRTVVEEHGPDSILFPNLRGEPRFDRWLVDQARNVAGQGVLGRVLNATEDHLSRGLRISSVPNVFAAVVPADEAPRLARVAQDAVRDFWQKEAESAGANAGEGDGFARRAREQAAAMVEVVWSAAPWPLVPELTDRGLREERPWHRQRPHADTALASSRKLASVFGGYAPNGGLFYPDSFEQAGLLVDAAKRERLQVTRDEGGLKCSVCGEREVLGPGSFWEQRQRREARHDAGVLGSGEQLCGPCTWKRRYDLQIGAPYGRRHPSTGEIAAAPFKLALIGRWRENEMIHRAMNAFVDAALDAARAGGIEQTDANVHAVQAVDLAARACQKPFVDKFASIDGQWLLLFPREEASQWVQDSERARQSVHALIEAASRLRREATRLKIDPPRPYLAVVVFDGDEMGKWVSGTHDGFPRMREVLHDKVKRQIDDALAPIDRELRRFLAPSFHTTLSGVAAAFSRYTAPMTVEGEGLCGHLVYAGGDDVLFLAPVAHALELVWRLRLRFSGWPGGFESEIQDAARVPVRPWVAVRFGERGLPMPAASDDKVDRLGLAFGGAATASAGMCVFHYRWPLGSALEMARQSEQEAKRYGRNALGITIQRRSGSITRTVLSFPEARVVDGLRCWNLDAAALTGFRELVKLLRDDAVSPRLASIFRAEVAALRLEEGDRAEALWEMARALAQRVVARREVETRQDVLDRLRACILAIGEAVRARANSSSEAIRQWAEALTAAAFLARPGEDR